MTLKELILKERTECAEKSNSIQHRNYNEQDHIELFKIYYGFDFTSDIEIVVKSMIKSIHGFGNGKGFLLMGRPGTGKTYLIKTIKKYCQKLNYENFIIKNSLEIQVEFCKNGYEKIEKYWESVNTLCIDDLGITDEANHYGSKTDIIANVLLMRYEKFQNFGYKTHCTTNLDANSLRLKYGDRIVDRMREMFNVIILDSETFRK